MDLLGGLAGTLLASLLGAQEVEAVRRGGGGRRTVIVADHVAADDEDALVLALVLGMED